MLLGQWARYLVSLERSLSSELEDLPDGIPNSLAASSRHEKPSSTEGFLSLDDKLIRRYEWFRHARSTTKHSIDNAVSHVYDSTFQRRA